MVRLFLTVCQCGPSIVARYYFQRPKRCISFPLGCICRSRLQINIYIFRLPGMQVICNQFPPSHCSFWKYSAKVQITPKDPYPIGDRRYSVYAWIPKVWERKGRVGRAIHSGEKGPPCHDGGSFLTTVFCPFPPSLFSLILLEFKHKLNFFGPLLIGWIHPLAFDSDKEF